MCQVAREHVCQITIFHLVNVLLFTRGTTVSVNSAHDRRIVVAVSRCLRLIQFPVAQYSLLDPVRADLGGPCVIVADRPSRPRGLVMRLNRIGLTDKRGGNHSEEWRSIVVGRSAPVNRCDCTGSLGGGSV